MTTLKFELADRTIVVGSPIEGVWYAGVTAEGNTGAVAKYENGEFTNSSGKIRMEFYAFLRRYPEMTKVPSSNHPVAPALRWLETLINSPAVPWDPAQRESAHAALAVAKAAI